MLLFVCGCMSLLQPSISLINLNQADSKLIEFAASFENLYGKGKTTSNMHLHLHMKECIINYGPVHAFWCFLFERYNGILGSFQINWISPELQMIKKFTAYQHLLLSDIQSSLPEELQDFFRFQLCQHKQHISEGSVEETQIDTLSLIDYLENRICPLTDINASLCFPVSESKRYQRYFTYEEVQWLSKVYRNLCSSAHVEHIPMAHEVFNECVVYGRKFLSNRARENHSSVIGAFWSLIDDCEEELNFGTIDYFFRHTICCDSKKITHIFAKVHWFKPHLQADWFTSPHITVLDTDFVNTGPVIFMPLSRVYSQCAIVYERIKFNFGYDSVCVAVKLSNNLFL